MGSYVGDFTNTIVKNWRDHPPFYALKINNLSQLNLEKYESRHFLSGGHNWKLVIYPEGNDKDNGDGFISMYVELDSRCFMSTPSTEVLAYLIFFVYNKKENKYFTLQDVEVKRFNALRTVWGLSQVLSLETFNEPKNGYIFDGLQCEFGVDVMVASPLTKWEIVSFNEKLSHDKISWSIEDFSVLEKNLYKSKSFLRGGKKWCLVSHLLQKSDSRLHDIYWYLLLKLDDSVTLMVDEKIYVLAHLTILDPHGSRHLQTNAFNNWCTESGEYCGALQILFGDEFRKTYLDVEDTLNVEIEFEVVSTIKYSP